MFYCYHGGKTHQKRARESEREMPLFHRIHVKNFWTVWRHLNVNNRPTKPNIWMLACTHAHTKSTENHCARLKCNAVLRPFHFYVNSILMRCDRNIFWNLITTVFKSTPSDDGRAMMSALASSILDGWTFCFVSCLPHRSHLPHLPCRRRHVCVCCCCLHDEWK